MRKGDVVICKSENIINTDGITVGKKYTLVDTLASTTLIRIINDYGYERNYYVRFFKTLQETREEIIDKLL